MATNRNYLETPGARVTRNERKLLKALSTLVTWRFDCPVIVNIGVQRGASLHCLRAGSPTARLIGVDVDYTKIPLEGDPQAVLICGRSQEAYEWLVNPVHLVFIDGGHGYDAVLQDAQRWGPKVVPGGIMAFHDYTPDRLESNPKIHEQIAAGIEDWMDTESWNTTWKVTRKVDSILVCEKRKHK